MSAVDASITALVTLLTMLFSISWQMTLVAILPLPFMAYATSRLGRKTHKAFGESQAAFSELNNNVRFVKRLIDGKPTLLIKNGQIDPEACRSVGLSASDVALKLRSQGIFQMKQVKRAVQEQNGQLIVVQMGDENPKYPVVTDGVIQVEILETIGRSEEWLLDNLSKQGYDNVANIFIAEYDKGVVSVVTYE